MKVCKSALAFLICVLVIIQFCPAKLLASGGEQNITSVTSESSIQSQLSQLSSMLDVQKYNRSIHIMAMLLVGFGFLMVFVKKYGRSAVTATYLLVSVAIPVYFMLSSLGIFGAAKTVDIEKLILAEFAAASLLICAGAVLGRLKMGQYIVLGVFFTLCYMLNEWIVLGGGFGLLAGGFVDTGGSIVIHAFGAIFGLGIIIAMTTKKELDEPIESDAVSDRFSMIGSMVLWLFWPSFCAALVEPAQIPHTAVNVVLALCGATIATYFASIIFRGGKISIADMANATLAGGVAIGSTCDHAGHPTAFVIGILSGVLSVFGFAVIQGRLQKKLKCVDTCGVLNLHGWPGLMGGIAAIFVVDGINKFSQLKGIGISMLIAIVTGYITGKILSSFGRRTRCYIDSEEFADAEA
ncbi:MAG: ammonium transporter [Sedimentisphaerales bacterium]